jgi:hypothetical protein
MTRTRSRNQQPGLQRRAAAARCPHEPAPLRRSALKVFPCLLLKPAERGCSPFTVDNARGEECSRCAWSGSSRVRRVSRRRLGPSQSSSFYGNANRCRASPVHHEGTLSQPSAAHRGNGTRLAQPRAGVFAKNPGYRSAKENPTFAGIFYLKIMTGASPVHHGRASGGPRIASGRGRKRLFMRKTHRRRSTRAGLI